MALNIHANMNAMLGGLFGALFGFLSWIIILLVIGSSGMITTINSALTGICDSGWMLATFFNPSGGILTLFIVLGLFVLVAVGSVGGALIGMSANRK